MKTSTSASVGSPAAPIAGLRVAFPVTRAVSRSHRRPAHLAPPPRVRASLPMDLPGDAIASALRADPDTWIVGAVPTGPRRRSPAASARATSGSPRTGGYVVARSRARAFAAALRSALCSSTRRPTTTCAPPTTAMPTDPLSGPPADWRSKVAGPDLTPPPVVPESPLIALVDAAADLTHEGVPRRPEHQSCWGTRRSRAPHGTGQSRGGPRRRRTASGSSACGRARACSTCRCPIQGRDRTPARPPATRSPKAVQKRRRGDQHELRLHVAQCPLGMGPDLLRGGPRASSPVAAAGNEFAPTATRSSSRPSLPHVVTVAATHARRLERVVLERQRRDRHQRTRRRDPHRGPAETLDGHGARTATRRSTGRASPRRWSPPRLAWVRAARPELKARPGGAGCAADRARRTAARLGPR